MPAHGATVLRVLCGKLEILVYVIRNTPSDVCSQKDERTPYGGHLQLVKPKKSGQDQLA